MQIIKLFLYISKHALAGKNRNHAYLQLLKWQLAQKIINRPIVLPFLKNSVLLTAKGMTGATGNIYTGLHEFEEMAFLVHFLREEDVFFDVGANIGSYTILASKVVGAKSFSFEPSPATFEHLKNNVFLNRVNDRVSLSNMGVGSEKGKLNFTTGEDTTNHVLMEKQKNSIEISIDSLDEICKRNQQIPQLIKIDVEGFETNVIQGAREILKESALKAVIIELNGSGGRYDFDEDQLHAEMLAFGFRAYHYHPFERKLTPREKRSFHGNTLYIKDIDMINNRLETAPSFERFGVNF